MARRRDKGMERDIAVRRIDSLVASAHAEMAAGNGPTAQRHGALALRIAQRYQTGLAPNQRLRLCRKCGSARVGGKTSRTRIRAGRIITTCLSCGATSRRPLAARAARLRAEPPAPARSQARRERRRAR
jgi:ribonuclease P protein subunit RPR2